MLNLFQIFQYRRASEQKAKSQFHHSFILAEILFLSMSSYFLLVIFGVWVWSTLFRLILNFRLRKQNVLNSIIHFGPNPFNPFIYQLCCLSFLGVRCHLKIVLDFINWAKLRSGICEKANSFQLFSFILVKNPLLAHGRGQKKMG